MDAAPAAKPRDEMPCAKITGMEIAARRRRTRQLQGVPVSASIAAMDDRGMLMSDKVEFATLKVAESKPYAKPTLVKGPVLASVTAMKQGISGVQQSPPP